MKSPLAFLAFYHKEKKETHRIPACFFKKSFSKKEYFSIGLTEGFVKDPLHKTFQAIKKPQAVTCGIIDQLLCGAKGLDGSSN